MKILDIPLSGSLGGIYSSHSRGGQHRQSRRAPVVSNRSSRGSEQKARFKTVTAAWQNLSRADQAAWVAFAASNPVTDRLGQSILLTGHQMWCRVAGSLLNAGLPLPTLPPSTAGFPGVEILSFSLGTVFPSAQLHVSPAGSSADRLCVAVSPPVSPGISRPPTWFQVGVYPADNTYLDDFASAIIARFGNVLTGQKMFVRVRSVSSAGSQSPWSLSSTISTDLVPGAVASYNAGASTLSFVWPWSNPDQWETQVSFDHGGSWTHLYYSVGSIRSLYAPATGNYYRVQPRISGHYSAQPSNSVVS